HRLVRLAELISLLDALVGPGLPAVGRGGLRVVDSLLGPGDGEARVEDAAGIERRLRLVDDREWRDRSQARRIGLCREELADPAVRDPHHPDLVVQDPGLLGYRMDDVVAVEALKGLEEVERAARAAGAA